jgi:predicted transposase/invertase (TIGR01784 family)
MDMEILEMDPAIRRAEEKMAALMNDKEALRAYQMREMALSDYTSGINHAKREGIAEGKREGIREGEKKEKGKV